MAYEESLKCISLNISASLASYQYRFLKMNAAGTVTINETSGGACIGVNQGKESTVGAPATVGVSGVSKITLGAAASTAGINLMSDTTGRAILATTGKYIMGKLLTTGVENDVVSMLIDKEGIAD